MIILKIQWFVAEPRAQFLPVPMGVAKFFLLTLDTLAGKSCKKNVWPFKVTLSRSNKPLPKCNVLNCDYKLNCLVMHLVKCLYQWMVLSGQLVWQRGILMRNIDEHLLGSITSLYVWQVEHRRTDGRTFIKSYVWTVPLPDNYDLPFSMFRKEILLHTS